MSLEVEIKELIIKSLALEEVKLDDIQDNMPLFDGGLGLDSIDALELGLALKKKYSLPAPSGSKEENKKHFYSVKTIADFIRAQQNG